MGAARVDGVKTEGGRDVAHIARAIAAAGIPVMGYLSYPVWQAPVRECTADEALKTASDFVCDLRALEDAGCFAAVLIGVPHDLAAMLDRELRVVTVGLGSGPECDGQVLAVCGTLGLSNKNPHGARATYADLAPVARDAIERFVSDVGRQTVPDITRITGLSPQELTTVFRGPER